MSRRLGSAGKPASQFWQCEQRSGVRGCPQGKRRGGGAGTPAKCPPPGRPRLTTSQNKRRGSTGERRSVPGFRAGGEQGTQQGTHEERQRKPHEPGQAGLNPPAARQWRNRPGRPPGQRRGSRSAPTGRCFNPPAARAVTEPPQPPAGTEKRWPARPDRAVLQPPTAGQGASTQPPAPPRPAEQTSAPLTLPGRRGRWRGNARPGRAAG